MYGLMRSFVGSSCRFDDNGAFMGVEMTIRQGTPWRWRIVCCPMVEVIFWPDMLFLNCFMEFGD